MYKSVALSAALASVLALGVVATPVLAAEESMETCCGAAMKGANDGASANGSHRCAGQARADKGPNEWK